MNDVTTLPPGPRGGALALAMVRFRRDPLGFLTDLARRHGDIAGFNIGTQRLFLINHPDYIRDVLITHNRNFVKSRGLEMTKRLLGEGLLTSEGEFHRRQRRLSQPAFHRQRIAAYAEMMVDYGMRIRERWRNGETIDAHKEMMQLTLGVVAKTLFGSDVESEAREIGDALGDTMQLFPRVANPFAPILDKLPLPSNARFIRGRARLDATIYRIIEERRREGIDRGDLLSMLLMAHDEEGDGTGMSDLQLRDEAMTIFLAGHETTANALVWTWLLLSEHPEIEARLHAEIDEVLGGRRATYEDIPKLVYTEQVLAESMRIYPPAWTIGRRALEEYEIDGYIIPRDGIILMSQYVTHRDPRYFPDPLRFDPDRWTPEAREARPKFSYYPFGGGPRICIGESFAWMEGILLLATIAQQWTLRLAPSARVVLEPLITLRPKFGLNMRLVRRSDTTAL